MTILFFTRLFFPHIGGVEKHVQELSKRLINKKHTVVVVTEQHERDLINYEKRGKQEIFRIPISHDGFFKKFEIWYWLWKHKSLIEKADLVHCHDVFYWYLPFRFFYPKKPVYTTFHGYESYPISKKNIFVRKISEIFSRRSICIGDFMKKWYKAKPEIVSYGGVNIEKRKNVIPRNNNSAIFIGRLDDQTGITTYTKAIDLIKKKIPSFDFLIVGDGEYRNKIEKKYKVFGFKKNINDYLYNSNFAFVSRYLSILEAMAAKKLVFAVFDNPLKEDYLKMTPFSKFIVLANSENQLAKKILFFLKNKNKKEEMIESAYQWVKNQSWENLTSEYLKLWRV